MLQAYNSLDQLQGFETMVTITSFIPNSIFLAELFLIILISLLNLLNEDFEGFWSDLIKLYH